APVRVRASPGLGAAAVGPVDVRLAEPQGQHWPTAAADPAHARLTDQLEAWVLVARLVQPEAEQQRADLVDPYADERSDGAQADARRVIRRCLRHRPRAVHRG